MTNTQPPSFQPRRKRPRTASVSSARMGATGGRNTRAVNHAPSGDAAVRSAQASKDWRLPEPWKPENPQGKQLHQGQSAKLPHSVRNTSVPPSITPRTRRSIKDRMNMASPGGNDDKRKDAPPVTQGARKSPVRQSPMPPAFQPQRSRTGVTSQQKQPAAYPPQQRPGTYPFHNADQNPYSAQDDALNEDVPRKTKKRKKRTGLKVTALVIVLLLIALISWPLYLIHSVNSRIERVDALSSMASGSGETWLIAGSDRRGGKGTTEESSTGSGSRSDTIMLVHKASNGQAAVVSIPRDSAVEVPGHGLNKINSAYSFGGAPLLVQTVESLTGIKIDHYIETSMEGVIGLVDAVGGVEVCYDRDVNDSASGMEWKAGCHEVNGQQALAYSRMRYQDPMGDIGRATRQRNVVKAVVEKAVSKETLLSPTRQRELADAGVKTIRADRDTGVIDIGRLLLAYRKAANDGMSGPPPISSLGYTDGAHGSMVLLDPEKSPQFWLDFNAGTLKKDSFGSLQ